MDYLADRQFWIDLQKRFRYLGWQTTVGVALILAATMIATGLLYPKWQTLKQLQHDLTKLRQDMPKHQGQWIVHSPQASLNTFYAFLPTENQTISSLSLIFLAAKEYQLSPQKVDYQIVRYPEAKFAKYQVSLPVTGSYVAVRRFVISILNELPSAALNEISFRRNNSDGNNVEATIRFSLFFSRQ